MEDEKKTIIHFLLLNEIGKTGVNMYHIAANFQSFITLSVRCFSPLYNRISLKFC